MSFENEKKVENQVVHICSLSLPLSLWKAFLCSCVLAWAWSVCFFHACRVLNKTLSAGFRDIWNVFPRILKHVWTETECCMSGSLTPSSEVFEYYYSTSFRDKDVERQIKQSAFELTLQTGYLNIAFPSLVTSSFSPRSINRDCSFVSRPPRLE